MRRLLPLALLITAQPFMHAQTTNDYDAYLAQKRVQANEEMALWRAAKTAAGKEQIAGKVIDAAVHADYPEAVLEIASSGVYPGRETTIPSSARTIKLTILRTLEKEQAKPWDGTYPWVIRRISAKAFEAWQPKHGLLFDENGDVLNEARPPRRDGVGREWYGAFLPDGRWITTDLWDFDRTLSLFSAAGKYLLEIPSARLIAKSDDDWGTDLIGWARSDKDGKGWIVSVGSEGGRGIACVSPGGTHRVLADNEIPFGMCFPRDLEPKGFYISLFTYSDDLQLLLERTEAGHGAFVGYPAYSWPQGSPGVVLAGGEHHFGFLPASHRAFIARGNYDSDPTKFETWFYDKPQAFAGWIAARPLGNAAAKGAMLFQTGNGDVVTLNSGLKATSRVRFVVASDRSVVAEKIFPDLRIGFFRDGDHLILARWKGSL